MRNIAKKHGAIIKVIAHSIEKDDQGIKDLLKKNGVNADAIQTKRQLTKVFLESLAKSKPLAIDFGKYVENRRNLPTSSNLVDEREVFQPLDLSNLKQDIVLNDIQPIQTTMQITNTSSTTSTPTYIEEKTDTGFFSGINLKDLLNTGVKTLELQKDMQVSKDNTEAVKQAVQINRDQMNLTPTKKTDTGTIVLISVLSAVAIGTILYFILKKKK